MKEITLEKIDAIRERTKVTYKEAKVALEACDGNIVDALIYVENHKKKRKEELYITKDELIKGIKSMVKKGNINRIRIKKDDKVIVDIPLNAGVAVTTVGLMISQMLTLGIFTVALTQVTIEIIKDDGSKKVINKVIKSTVNDITEKVGSKVFEVKEKIFPNKSHKNIDENMCSYTVNFDEINFKK